MLFYRILLVFSLELILDFGICSTNNRRIKIQDEIIWLELDGVSEMSFSFRSRLRDKAAPECREEHIAPKYIGQ